MVGRYWDCRGRTKLEVDVLTIYVRPMRRKWASCSAEGNLNFSEELLGLEPELADYVIVHELLHFSVPESRQALEEPNARAFG
jgi:predicted metal-dependent hydrolase